MNIKDNIKEEFEKISTVKERAEFLNSLRSFLFSLSPFNVNPVDHVKWVPLEKVIPNNYNPNSVAKNEMRLLYTSILHDGYTQPIVTIYDEDQGVYVIVDGFHRHLVSKYYKDIYDRNFGFLPCVVINKQINDRMASTIRHNRARGKHSVQGMSNVVFQMLQNKWSDEDICNELGLEPDELVRLKHITGFSKLFENVEYGKAWETETQVRLRKQYESKP